MKELKVKQREEAVVDKEIQNALQEKENIKKANSLREEKKSMEARIKKAADNLVKYEIQNLKASYIRKEVDLEQKYNMKYMAVRGLIFLIMMYGIIITTFTGLLDDRFREDMIIFLSVIWKFLKGVYAVASGLGGLSWSLKDRIPYDYVNVAVAGALVGVSFIVLFGFVFGVIGYVIYHIMRFYVEEFWDLISLGVTLGTLALLVWYGEWIGIAFPINLVVLWIALQFIYVIGRMIIFRDKRRW